MTGFFYEPWHYRYVGVEMATQLKAVGQSLTEYQLATEPPPCVPDTAMMRNRLLLLAVVTAVWLAPGSACTSAPLTTAPTALPEPAVQDATLEPVMTPEPAVTQTVRTNANRITDRHNRTNVVTHSDTTAIDDGDRSIRVGVGRARGGHGIRRQRPDDMAMGHPGQR